MTKILFVCHGNICRSPMAEYVMRDLVCKAGCTADFQIASAAVSSEETGNPVYPQVRRLLAAHGIDCAGKTARTLRRTDYQTFDMLIGMDGSNLRRMRQICGGDPAQKMSLLGDYRLHPGDIADPWYTGDFERTWLDILEGCSALLSRLVESGKH